MELACTVQCFPDQTFSKQAFNTMVAFLAKCLDADMNMEGYQIADMAWKIFFE